MTTKRDVRPLSYFEKGHKARRVQAPTFPSIHHNDFYSGGRSSLPLALTHHPFHWHSRHELSKSQFLFLEF
jgi:hypothetical protein